MFGVFCLVVTVVGFSKADLSNEYQNNLKLHESYTMYWTHNSSESTMYFAVKARAVGWVAFGFANKIDNMKGYDVVVGYVTVLPGKMTWDLRDYHTVGHQPPYIDSKQNIAAGKSAKEENGYTILKFKRQLDTHDEGEDITIKPGQMIVVWSYSNVDNVATKHSERGYKTVTLIPGGASTAHVVSWLLLLSTSALVFMIS